MAPVAVIVPTVGRPSLWETLRSLATQTTTEDRVVVMVDNPKPGCFEFVQRLRDRLLEDVAVAGTWRVLPTHSDEPLGCFGHSARNLALEYLAELGWDGVVWSIDDDDIAAVGALAAISQAPEVTPAGSWFVFPMIGGAGSHFAGRVVPTMGNQVLRGNVGTPMIVAPIGESRYGTSPSEHGDGYFGDFEIAEQLVAERGQPVWINAIVAVIRPAAETA